MVTIEKQGAERFIIYKVKGGVDEYAMQIAALTSALSAPDLSYDERQALKELLLEILPTAKQLKLEL